MVLNGCLLNLSQQCDAAGRNANTAFGALIETQITLNNCSIQVCPGRTPFGIPLCPVSDTIVQKGQ